MLNDSSFDEQVANEEYLIEEDNTFKPKRNYMNIALVSLIWCLLFIVYFSIYIEMFCVL